MMSTIWPVVLISCSENKEEIDEPPHDKTNKMTCAPSEDRSAWVSAQSDQSLRCLHEETWADAQADLSLR